MDGYFGIKDHKDYWAEQYYKALDQSKTEKEATEIANQALEDRCAREEDRAEALIEELTFQSSLEPQRR